MPNYSLSINSTFQPLSFERYIQPYQIYGEEYKRQENALNELEMKASIWEGLANKQTDKRAYEQYKQYADALRQQADAIATNGLNIGTRRALNDLRRRYATDILPIEQAYTRRAEQQKAQRELIAKDPTRLFNRMASQQSLDYYMDNPTYDATEQQYSGALITGQVSQAAKAIANEISSYGIHSLPGDSYTNAFMAKHGLTSEQVMQYLADPNNSKNSPVFKALVNDAMTASGIPSWNNQEMYDKGVAYANMGLWDTIGKQDVAPTENYGSRKALEHKYHEEEAEAAHRRAIDLQDRKHQDDMELYGIRYGDNSSNPFDYISADSITFGDDGAAYVTDPTTGGQIPVGDIASLIGGGSGSGSGGKSGKSGKSSKSSKGGSGGGGLTGTLPLNTFLATSPHIDSSKGADVVNKMFGYLGGRPTKGNTQRNVFTTVDVPRTATVPMYDNTTMSKREFDVTTTKKYRLWKKNPSGSGYYMMSRFEFVAQGKTKADKDALYKYYMEKVVPARHFFGLSGKDDYSGYHNPKGVTILNKAYDDAYNKTGSVNMRVMPLKLSREEANTIIPNIILQSSPNMDDRMDIRKINSWNADGTLEFGERVPAKELIKKSGDKKGELVDPNAYMLDRPIPGDGSDNDASNYIIIHSDNNFYAVPKAKQGSIMNDSKETSYRLKEFDQRITNEKTKLFLKIKAAHPKLTDEEAAAVTEQLWDALNSRVNDIYDNLGAAYTRQVLEGVGYRYKVPASDVTTTTINSQQ